MPFIREIFEPVSKDLKKLEEELRELVDSNLDPLTTSSTYLLNSGGKRLRPALVLLSGKMFDYDFEKLKPIAAAVEFIHMASLVHDDVIDGSNFRRGSESVNNRWQNKVAVLSGDLFYTFSTNLLANLEDETYLNSLLEAALEMTKGQADQVINKDNYDLSLKDYLERIRRKTACLMGKSCLLGAKASGASRDVQERIEKFGLNLGLSFQIMDDLKDLLDSKDEMGKEPGNDLKEGILTLPVMIAMNQTPREAYIRKLLREEKPTEVEIRKGIEIIKRSGAIDDSLRHSKRFAQKAISCLPEVVRGSPVARASLRAITWYLSGYEVRGKSYLDRSLATQGGKRQLG